MSEKNEWEFNERNTTFFWDRVNKQDDGCWMWTGMKAKAGYPVTKTIDDNGKYHNVSARRYIWHLQVDPKEIGGIIACKKHSMCVNPEHLGANHSKVSNITEERVEEIRRSLNYFMTHHTRRRVPSMY